MRLSQTWRSVAPSAPRDVNANVAPVHSVPAPLSRCANASRWAGWISWSSAAPASGPPASRSNAGLAPSTVPSGATDAASIARLSQV